MSFQVSKFFEEAYTSAAELLLQQTQSYLTPYVTRGNYKGKIVSPIKQIGETKVRKVTGRYSLLGMQDVPLTRRWLEPVDYDNEPTYIDPFELLRITTDNGNAETSELAAMYAESLKSAVEREMDTIIMSNFFSTAKVGESGAITDVSFPTTQDVANTVGAASATGMNVEKLKRAARILQDNEVHPEKFGKYYCAITPRQNEQLLQDIQVLNNLYMNSIQPTVVNGMIKSVLGFEFIQLSEKQFTKVGADWYVPVWVKDGMHMGNWMDVSLSVYRDTTRVGHPTAMYSMWTANATRTQEKKVVRILATD